MTLLKDQVTDKKVALRKLEIDGQQYLKIEHVDQMRPFFMSIVSHSDHWMFISSNGGLTAGRRDSNHALFPYYTDDKVTESAEITGSKTIIRVSKNGQTVLWEPLSQYSTGHYHFSRHLYKTRVGNKVRFEEVNHDLDLTFWYEWSFSEQYGFIRTSSLNNHALEPVEVEVIDGLQNVLPSSVGEDLQNRASNLVDAYKRSELIKAVGLGIYALSAIIVDKAEPSEALRANIVWGLGLNGASYLLSSKQLEAFRSGDQITEETDVKAEKGAYFRVAKMRLPSKADIQWHTVADVNKDHSAVVALKKELEEGSDVILERIKDDVYQGTQDLVRLVAASDGLQLSLNTKRNMRHFSNTLFNIMRGGIFDQNFQIEKSDFLAYLANANKHTFKSHQKDLDSLPHQFTVFDLQEHLRNHQDLDFIRLSTEYLPLMFSRRHGDPSRPWNKFTINIKDQETGEKVLDYEGNWRDIFQNWEALVASYPHFIHGMIFKFLNASTFDGYNPYRVTKDGFDWETIEPDDPWSYIGYWGDHQIIYLLKFLEYCEDAFPGQLRQYFDEDLFVYANVPYRIKKYSDILRDPKDTIDFDHDADEMIRERREELGADGALLTAESGEIYRVNFIEKILATTLAKLSNFIPEGGIWMNTQRPEWNDANNALVGNGVSVVTLGYLLRMFSFLEKQLEKTELESVQISNEVVDLYKTIRGALQSREAWLNGKISDHQRRELLDELGQAASSFRGHVYEKGLWGKKRTISLDGLRSFVKITLRFLEHTLRANRRSDEMYHAYNLMSVAEDGGVQISYLSEMLEGQVSILSSGILEPVECVKLLDGLKNSALFRHDQYSYLLYPNKDLPGFMERNNVPEKLVNQSDLLRALVQENDHQIILKDVQSNYHFNGQFKNASDLENALDELKSGPFGAQVEKEKKLILDIFEEVFDHQSFTGRSGTFFGYEGLGSIYWHMVSKLLLAVQECCLSAIDQGASDEIVGRLLEHYYEINEGIGVHKPPELYGAFPTDPYSHTPAGKGAQQPGMTGQVKEDILSRFGELGVYVQDGCIQFNPRLLRRGEFLTESSTFLYFNVRGERQELMIEPDCLVFTYCQVPVVYQLSDQAGIELLMTSGEKKEINALRLTQEDSSHLMRRSGKIGKLTVHVTADQLR